MTSQLGKRRPHSGRDLDHRPLGSTARTSLRVIGRSFDLSTLDTGRCVGRCPTLGSSGRFANDAVERPASNAEFELYVHK